MSLLRLWDSGLGIALGPCLSSLDLKEATGSRVAKIDARKTVNAEVLVRKGSPVMVYILKQLSCPRCLAGICGNSVQWKRVVWLMCHCKVKGFSHKVLPAVDLEPIYCRTRPWRH